MAEALRSGPVPARGAEAALADVSLNGVEAEGLAGPGLQRGTSDLATASLLLKTTVGGMLLVIPGAFKDAGLISAAIVLMVVSGCEIYCMTLLIKCRRVIGRGAYGDIVRCSLGWMGYWAVNISLVLSQLGFVICEMLYVAKNTHGALAAFGSSVRMSETQILLWHMLFAVPMSWVRHLRYFRASNVVATGIAVSALAVISAYSAAGLASQGVAPSIQYFGRGWLLFAGTAVVCFECVNFVLPMYEEHGNKSSFLPILTGTLWSVVALFIAFGAINYLFYGDGTMSVVSLNLPSDSRVGKIIPFAFALASLLNIPLFLFPAADTIESKLFGSELAPLVRKWGKNALRTALIIACTCISIFGADRMDIVIAFIGSFCCVPLAFVYPAVSHIILCRPGVAGIAIDSLVIVVGAALFVMTTREAIRDW